ncbi:hypothetical protein [Halococcus sp. PRR34]|uniref:hypothetical protein n=1 Tax=Halococcus sp. PRR34 TaxID=3020830 RepID=UPI002360B6DB|nr:hypothetical protein [Halococcus sp. PRR34]
MSHRPIQDVPELPSLDAGIHLLDVDDRTAGALQSLVVDHLLTDSHGETAVWVDSRGNGSTQPIARLAPGKRVLERIEIARGFTAHQHYSLLESLAEQVGTETALVVLPDLDWFYRSDDLYSSEGERMLAEGIALIEDLCQQREITILLTRTAADGFSQPIRNVAGGVIECELTSQGPRFVGEGFETLVYSGSGFMQTTFAYWNRVLSQRHPEAIAPTSQPEVAAVGAN